MKRFILLFLLLATNCFCQPNSDVSYSGSDVSYSDRSGYTEKSEVILSINPLNNCELRYDFYPNYDAYYDRKEEVYLVLDLDKSTWLKVDYINPNYRGYSVYNRTHYTIKDYDGDDIIKLYPIHKKKFPYATRKHY